MHDPRDAVDPVAEELALHESLRGASIRRALSRGAKPSKRPAAPVRPRAHGERGAAPSGVVVLAAAIVLQLAVFASSSLAKARGPVALGASDAHVASLLDRFDNLRLLR